VIGIAPVEMRSPEEIEAMKKAGEKKDAGGSGGDSSITKSEMMSEMRCMIQGLMEVGLLTPKGLPEVKLELVPNEVKLEGSRNYLSWSRRVQVLLGAKGLEHYLQEGCVEPIDKTSTEWKVWHATNSTSCMVDGIHVSIYC
jgi:hypothetical protein